MMRKLTIIATVVFGGALACPSNIAAQTFGAEYATEWQTDFSGGYNWVNLLKTSAEIPVASWLSVEASTISTAKTDPDQLVEDLLTYSNIEADNIALTFARLGLAFNVKNACFFVGINNVNEDYFTSDLTSFFTNSSCGISPTISCNFDIANYPLASWCVHYGQQFGKFCLQSSLYPGRGYSRLLGHDNLFSLDIKRDGVFSISSIDYKHNGIYTVLGVALHHGVCMGDESGEQDATEEASTQNKRFTVSPWLLTEITLPHNLGLHIHASYSSVKSGCKGYGAVGLIYDGRRVQPGVALNYAYFTSTSEFSAELTCRVPLNDKVYLQPALHLINTDSQNLKCVGMLRCCLNI